MDPVESRRGAGGVSGLSTDPVDGLSVPTQRSAADRADAIPVGSLAWNRTALRSDVRRLTIRMMVRRSMGSFVTDVRAAARALRRAPTSTVAGILALAVGIGGTTTMLGLVDAIDVRPLPFPHPEQLVTLQEVAPRGSPYCYPGRGCEQTSTSVPTIADWRAARSLADVAGYRLYGEHRWILDGASSEPIEAIEVTGNFFSLLGARPFLGREFQARELVPGGPPAIILSYDFWQTRLGGESHVLGTVVTLRDMNRQVETPFTVVGVMPQGFRFLKEAAFLPMQPDRPSVPDSRASRLVLAIGRLSAGYTLQQARAELGTIAARTAAAFPETNQGWSATASALNGPALLRLAESIVADAGRGRFILLGVVAMVLLVAVLNVGALLLARGLARLQELAVRAAIGASRAQLAQHLLVESACIAVAGGALGILIAVWGVGAARGWLSTPVGRAPSRPRPWLISARLMGSPRRRLPFRAFPT